MCDSRFDSLSWLSLKTAEQNSYLMKYCIDDLSLKLIICDLCYVYEEVLSAEEALRRFTYLNKDIEISKNVLIQELKDIFSNLVNGTLLSKVSFQDGSLIIKTTTKLFGEIDIEWQSILQRTTPEVFHRQFTIPLLALNHNLNATVTDLTDVVKKKDRQINDYKSQRAKLIVKHFETPDFDENEFMNRRCSEDILKLSLNASTANANDSCLKLAEDRCFQNICQKIYCKQEQPIDNTPKVEPIDETQEELRKRKELEDKLSSQRPSAMPRKKKLNL